MSGYDTVWPADSTEFCPHPSARDIFVCGTYKLEQSEGLSLHGTEHGDTEETTGGSSSGPQIRRGKCLLFRVEEDDQLCANFC